MQNIQSCVHQHLEKLINHFGAQPEIKSWLCNQQRSAAEPCVKNSVYNKSFKMKRVSENCYWNIYMIICLIFDEILIFLKRQVDTIWLSMLVLLHWNVNIMSLSHLLPNLDNQERHNWGIIIFVTFALIIFNFLSKPCLFPYLGSTHFLSTALSNLFKDQVSAQKGISIEHYWLSINLYMYIIFWPFPLSSIINYCSLCI